VTDSYTPQPGYQLTVNGERLDVADAWVGESLLHVLRERLQLPGAKSACEQGECGSCSVLIDHKLVCACLVAAITVTECEITTVESSGSQHSLSVVQQAFVDAGAVQCGFCTPGLIMAVEDLLERRAAEHGAAPFDELATREALSGNLCRCTGYGRILDAVARAVERSVEATA
jgi:aerobic carbon-monoxide dehydrogenase small subunit